MAARAKAVAVRVSSGFPSFLPSPRERNRALCSLADRLDGRALAPSGRRDHQFPRGGLAAQQIRRPDRPASGDIVDGKGEMEDPCPMEDAQISGVIGINTACGIDDVEVQDGIRSDGCAGEPDTEICGLARTTRSRAGKGGQWNLRRRRADYRGLERIQLQIEPAPAP